LPGEEDKPLTYHLAELLSTLRKSLLALIITGLFVAIIPSGNPFQGSYLSYVPLVVSFSNKILNFYIPQLNNGTRLIDVFGRKVGVIVFSVNPLDVFNIYIYLTILLGLIISSPYISYQFFKFVKPALYPHERKAVKWIILLGSSFFFIGSSFGFFVLLPIVFKTLVLFQLEAGITPTFSYSDLMNFIIQTTIFMRLAYEIPLVVYYVISYEIINYKYFEGASLRYVIAITMILSIIIAPPDPTGISVLSISLPLIVSYILAVKIAKRRLMKKLKEKKVSINDL